MSNLTTHARTELTAIGEEPDVIDWYCRVIDTFASAGHSGGSASVAIPTLNALLQYQNLGPLTSDPSEWRHIAEEIAGEPSLWQSRRNPEAFSHDGGVTYYLLSEGGRNGSARHTAVTR